MLNNIDPNQNLALFEKVFSGGTDNTSVSMEELEVFERLLILAKNVDEEELRADLSEAALVAERRLTWRIKHSHELSVDQYKVRVASLLIIAAIVFAPLAGFMRAPSILQFACPLLCVVLVFLSIAILRSRNRLWDDYRSSVE